VSKHLLVILLIVSLAFNLAVAGMFLYTSIYHRPPFYPPGIGMMPGHDNHDHWFHKKDRDEHNPFQEENEEIQKLRDDFMQKRMDFMHVMMQEGFVDSAAVAAMESSLKAQEELERKLGAALIEMRSKMNNEEAKEYFQKRLDRIEKRADKSNKWNKSKTYNPKGENK
jgi:hypothetical protein